MYTTKQKSQLFTVTCHCYRGCFYRALFTFSVPSLPAGEDVHCDTVTRTRSKSAPVLRVWSIYYSISVCT